MRDTSGATPPPPPADDDGSGRRTRLVLVKDLQNRLNRASDPDTRVWFENYLKHAIEFRGVKTPEVARIVAEWRTASSLKEWQPETELALAAELIRQRKCEDKLAGIILAQGFLVKRLAPAKLLGSIEGLFGEGAIWDWSTNDSLCARVLSPILRKHGMQTAIRIAGWRTSANLWQRRSSAVALRAVAGDPSFHPLVATVIGRLVQEQERFIQTGAGWLLADLSKHAPKLAAQLAETHFDHLSAEVVRRHLKYLPDCDRYKARKRYAATRPGH